jgi:hypothetical protein
MCRRNLRGQLYGLSEWIEYWRVELHLLIV